MNLFDKIEYLYPGLTDNYNVCFNPPFKLSDHGDGRGPVISEWNNPNPQPTQEQLGALDNV